MGPATPEPTRPEGDDAVRRKVIVTLFLAGLLVTTWAVLAALPVAAAASTELR
jgi:hypothetical protein